MEFGIFKEASNCLKTNAEISYKTSLKVYNSLDMFIKDNTKFDDLIVHNFETIFLAFFLINCTWIISFLIYSNFKTVTLYFKMLFREFRFCLMHYFNQIIISFFILIDSYKNL